MRWRLAARLLTGPLAFALGGVMDIAAYTRAARRARRDSRRRLASAPESG